MSIFENFKNLGHVSEDEHNYEHPIGDEDMQDVRVSDKEKINTTTYYVLVLCFCLIFSFRLFHLQIVKGHENQFLAEGNRIRVEEFLAPRGIIFDQHHYPLVKNVPLYNLEIYPVDLPREKAKRIQIYEELKNYLEDDLGTLIDEIEHQKLYSLESIIIKTDLDRNDALKMQIDLHNLAGVRINVIPTREYIQSTALSHILGYIGKISPEFYQDNMDQYSVNDYVGQNGLEVAYEEYLRGEKGARRVEVDSIGHIQRELETKDPIAGSDIITTINASLQEKTTQVLKETIAQLQAEGKRDVTSAVVVALDPRDGGVLAMVSVPYYDNNIFSKGIRYEDYEAIINDPTKPMLNRAIGGIYPSGSVIKPVIALASLDTGVVTEHTTIDAPKEIKIGEWVFPDWKRHGLVDIRKSIAVSCNIFFYAVGGGWENIKGMGVKTINEYLDRFGFGKRTGIEISGEERGTIPNPEWKEKVKNESWYLGDTYNLSIGQGDFLVTPLQIANSISAIANGGNLYRPHFVSRVQDREGNIIKEYLPEIISDKLSENSYSIEVAKQGMKQCVDSSIGSCRKLQELPVSSGGKTGTAQFDARDLEKYHAWFTAFAPYENPEIVMVVLVEKAGQGSDIAVPIANEILKYYFENKNHTPDESV